jgi:hypothetical protein
VKIQKKAEQAEVSQEKQHVTPLSQGIQRASCHHAALGIF